MLTVKKLRKTPSNKGGIKSLADFFTSGHLLKSHECLKSGYYDLAKQNDPAYSDSFERGFEIFENYYDLRDWILEVNQCGKSEVWLDRQLEITQNSNEI